MPPVSIEPAPPTAPLPVLTRRPPMRDTFVSLKIRNYRLYMVAQAIAYTAVWAQRIATDWLVLELTGNVAAVGLTVAFQFAPMLLLGPLGGVLADRFPKRTLLITMQTITAVLTAVLATLAITGTAELWQVYGLVVLLGLAAVVDNPARSVFVNEMVGHDNLRNAISVNASIFHLGGLLGPAVAGVLIALVGAGWAIGINAVACTIGVVTLLLIRTADLLPPVRAPRSPGQIREALAYIRRKPAIRWTLVLLGVIAVFGMSMPILLAAFANEVYDTGAGGYGLFSSVAGLGALTGALLSTRRLSYRLRGLGAGAIVYGTLQAVAGAMPVYAVFLILLAGIGCARLLFMTAAESLVQLSTNRAIRGRIMSFYTMVLVGGQAIGGPLMGWIAEEFGPRLAMTVSGGVPAVAAVVVSIVLARSGHLTLRVDVRRGRALLSIAERAPRSRPVPRTH